MVFEENLYCDYILGVVKVVVGKDVILVVFNVVGDKLLVVVG